MPGHQRPKSSGMVLFFRMSQLVENHIFDYLRWSHYQSPVQTDCSPGRTGTPPGAGRRQAEFFKLEPVQAGQLLKSPAEVGSGHLAVELLKQFLTSALITCRQDKGPAVKSQGRP
jgi:hypothetical protein